MPVILINPQISCDYCTAEYVSEDTLRNPYGWHSCVVTTKRHVQVACLVVEGLFRLLCLPNRDVAQIRIWYHPMRWRRVKEEKLKDPALMVRITYHKSVLQELNKVLGEEDPLSATADTLIKYCPDVHEVDEEDRKSVEQLLLSLYQHLQDNLSGRIKKVEDLKTEAAKEIESVKGRLFPQDVSSLFPRA